MQSWGEAQGFSVRGENDWIESLVQSHPVLRGLPTHIQEALVVKVGDWKDLPLNKRLRKRCQRDGLMVHLYAGDDQGYTLKKAMKQGVMVLRIGFWKSMW